MSVRQLQELEDRYAMHTYARAPVEFVRGEGVHLWDADGREYLDFFAGLSVHNAGHCHPAIVAAIAEQAQRYGGGSNLFYSSPAMRLCERLAESSLGGRVFLANSGTEASEAAIKLVRKRAHARGIERPEIVTLEGGFHGRTLGALAATPKLAREELRVTMTAGTVLMAALVIGGIVAELRGVLGKLEGAAKTDPLTGLLNRRAFAEAFEIELARAGRGKFGVGVVMLDLDGFKRFNDDHGHPAGDAALQRLSHVLVGATRAIDHVARVGGEEFAILAPESTTAGTLALAERLRRAVEVEFSGLAGLTASCGVASYPDNGSDRVTLVGAADRALYEAKALGRNRAVASSHRPAAAPRVPAG